MINSLIISQSSNIADCVDDLPYNDIPSWIDQLSNADSFVRMQARAVLICIGKSAIPELVKAVGAADSRLRWQIVKVLEGIHDPSAIPVLVDQLKDSNADVRWAASNALIGLDREAIPSLLEILLHDYGSLWLRQSTHHIFHVFKDRDILTESELKVYEALSEAEPELLVPWAARRALQALKHL